MNAVNGLEEASKFSNIEWESRINLAALYRSVSLYGMSDLIYNHITARIPGTADHVLINSVGLLYDEITASNLCKIDLEGRVISRPDVGMGVSPAGYVIHSAIHLGRPDVACVIHTHSRASVAVSAMTVGLLPISQFALKFFGKISYHDYEGPALKLGERERLLDNLGKNDVMLLRNHGTLVTGRSIAEAFVNLYYLEMACRVQTDALSSGQELIVPGEPVCLETQAIYGDNSANIDPRYLDGSIEWDAVLRRLDRLDPSFRT